MSWNSLNCLGYDIVPLYLSHRTNALRNVYHQVIVLSRSISAKTPNEGKTLRHQIQHFDNEHWNKHAKDIMKTGLHEKFSQNMLLNPLEYNKLVEASATDKWWGAGLGLNDPKLSNVQLWSGKN